MRRFGQLLMGLGLAVGGIVGLGILVGLNWPDLPWFLRVGIAKLGLFGSAGIMTAGAVITRLARRAEQRRLGSPPAPHAEIGPPPTPRADIGR